LLLFVTHAEIILPRIFNRYVFVYITVAWWHPIQALLPTYGLSASSLLVRYERHHKIFLSLEVFMIKEILLFALMVQILLTGQAGAAPHVADPSQYVTQSISVTGNVVNPLSLNVEDLRKMAQQQVGDLALTGGTGVTVGRLTNIKAVRLRDILEKAVIVVHDHNDVKKTIIIATASDNYKAVFSWNELFNSPLGDGVLVFFEQDGKPLADDEGRIAMVSAKDTRTGPRHVKWLQSIEVKKIAD
jgi:hypothetical protein